MIETETVKPVLEGAPNPVAVLEDFGRPNPTPRSFSTTLMEDTTALMEDSSVLMGGGTIRYDSNVNAGDVTLDNDRPKMDTIVDKPHGII